MIINNYVIVHMVTFLCLRYILSIQLATYIDAFTVASYIHLCTTNYIMFEYINILAYNLLFYSM